MKPEPPPEPAIAAITGAHGFIGRNLVVRLHERGFATRQITRQMAPDEARQALAESEFVFHLAGASRPADPQEFLASNRDYAAFVADAIAAGVKRPLVICSSTIETQKHKEYYRSKRAGDAIMLDLAERDAATVAIYRLPNVFGKWARPNYNSVVATFSHNLGRDLPITVHDPQAPLPLLYVDDLIDQWLGLLQRPPRASGFVDPDGVHQTTVGPVAEQLRSFASGRKSGFVEEVGSGLGRALYATFVSALPEEAFSYRLGAHIDERGLFAEILKTTASGQFSFLTAHPGITRGGHYHHSKVEKFLVVQGRARFRFRHVLTGEIYELQTSGELPMVVETIPGWAHDITNVGDELMTCLLWANELFDPEHPDTVAMAV
ncbi:MAG TPA: NAD-dependent epimerase/dehydratase family protein [Sphingomicrobium sp.]|nr:NAD-dependent epimerase/dehydratase family protein [Sphingomicrobium sp.]